MFYTQRKANKVLYHSST